MLTEESFDAMIEHIRSLEGKPIVLKPQTYMITKFGMEEIIKKVGEEGVSDYLEEHCRHINLMIHPDHLYLFKKNKKC